MKPRNKLRKKYIILAIDNALGISKQKEKKNPPDTFLKTLSLNSPQQQTLSLKSCNRI